MIRQFLISDLSVPPNHIQVLVDADATRVAILSLLYSLRDNAEIQRGDAILIHYSGHGASYGADEFFRHTFGSIEAICPVDRGIEGADHGTIMDISDREINIFLTELCSVKGDNITLVLDCCFSGGVSRCSNPVPDNSPFQSRVAPPLVNSLEKMLRAAEDSRHKRLTGKSPLDEDWRPDVSSFVVLAACQDFERAWECNDGTGGDFTIALVTALKTQPLHTTTFIELIGRIGRLRRQQPCAVGTRIDNPVFHLRLEGYAIAGPGKVTREPENAGNGTLWGILSWLLTGLLY
jgi:hypothetical protein